MKEDDRVRIQWTDDDTIHRVTYVKKDRGFLIFRDDDNNMMIARKDALSICELEVEKNGNEQRNIRETPKTILSGTV